MARGTYGWEGGGRGKSGSTLPHRGDLWNTNQPANTFAHAGAKLPWDGEALRVSTFVSALDAVTLWALGASRGGDKNSYACVCVWRLVYSPLFANMAETSLGISMSLADFFLFDCVF